MDGAARSPQLVQELRVAQPGEPRVRRRVRLEHDAVRTPALDVTPREVCEAAATVRDVPPIEPAGIVRDDEARGAESQVAQHWKRVLAKPPVGVVERDEQLALAR